MKLIYCLLILLTFSLSSCTSFYTPYDRSVANVVETPLSPEDLFTIKSSTQINNKEDQSQFLVSRLRNLTMRNVEYVVDPKMPSENAFRIVPTIENQEYKFKIIASENAKYDANAMNEIFNLFDYFHTNGYKSVYITNYSFFELFYNVQEKDFPSMQVMAKIRAKNLEFLIENGHDFGDELKEWKTTLEQFEKQERIFNKQKKTKTEARKAVMDVLDKVSDDKQFRNLVAKNDRKGAAELIRSYLPWEEMPPFEKLFWETHLKVMADPLPIENRVLIYRGIDDDVVQRGLIGGKIPTHEDAVKEQNIFLMSTMMTKNQGTWNRRLRSLTAMYDKFMGTDHGGSNELTRAVRVTNMFKKHSADPKGSPFLSYTPYYHVANSFGYKRNTLYFMDPRMIYFNATSGFANEVEFLLPLASFPDDLAAVYDKDVMGYEEDIEMRLIRTAKERLEKLYGKEQATKIYDKMKVNTMKYFEPVKSENGQLAKKPLMIDGKFTTFFKKLSDIPAVDAAEIINNNSNMGCTDLIQLFWK